MRSAVASFAVLCAVSACGAAPAAAPAASSTPVVAQRATAARVARLEPVRPRELLEYPVLSSVLRRHRSTLYRCQRSVRSTMRFDVEIVVESEGDVADVRVAGPSAPVAWCVERTLAAWRFPRLDQRSFARFPLVFRPAARAGGAAPRSG